jgi:hypothetical protein
MNGDGGAMCLNNAQSKLHTSHCHFRHDLSSECTSYTLESFEMFSVLKWGIELMYCYDFSLARVIVTILLVTTGCQ